MSETSLDNHLHRMCGGRYAAAAERVTVRVSGMSTEVDRTFYRCAKCGDEQRTVEQREAAERAAVEHIRARNQLLTPKGIRQLRESLGLTAVQLGELLYGTPKGVIDGWERGRYLQNREADAMLRSLADRATLELRAAKAGVTLPAPDLLAGAAPVDAVAPEPMPARAAGEDAAPETDGSPTAYAARALP
jgi:putative zinc finger/helix-turn-helix YgiT family protein